MAKDPYLQEAFNLLNKNKISEAIDEAKRDIECGSSDVDKIVRFADRLRNSHRGKESLFFFDYAQKLDPNHFVAGVGKAKALHSINEHLLSSNEAYKLAALAKDDVHLKEQLFEVYIYKNASSFAEEVAESIFKQDPKLFSVHRGLIEMYVKRHEASKIKTAVDRFSKLQPGQSLELKFVADIYIELGEIGAAMPAAYKAVQLAEPPAILEIITLSNALALSGNRKAATVELNKIKEQLTGVEQFISVSEIYLLSGDTSSAVQLVNKTMELSPPDKLPIQFRIKIANVLGKSGKRAAAMDILSSINMADLRNYQLARNFHNACFEIDAFHLAESSAYRGLEITPYDNFFTKRANLLKLMPKTENGIDKTNIKKRSFWAVLGLTSR